MQSGDVHVGNCVDSDRVQWLANAQMALNVKKASLLSYEQVQWAKLYTTGGYE